MRARVRERLWFVVCVLEVWLVHLQTAAQLSSAKLSCCEVSLQLHTHVDFVVTIQMKEILCFTQATGIEPNGRYEHNFMRSSIKLIN